MSYSLIWLPNVLLNAGLKVALVDGWEFRGQGDVRDIYGVICHHTGTNIKNKNMASLRTLIDGRNDLKGPLAQLGLGRDGTYYVIAAGRCNHAGAGIWRGITNGNANFIGIEAENSGLANDYPWPAIQLEAYHRGVAALLKHIGRGADFCAGHREYALPKGRKPDPIFNMDEFRLNVKNIMDGNILQPELIPREEPTKLPGTNSPRPTIRRGATGDFVKELQQKLGLVRDGNFGPKTEAAVREFQRSNNLVPDGIVGPKTWALI